MGTWDTGPFDNDTAADFGGDLDEAALEEREPMIRGVLVRAASSVDFLGVYDGEDVARPALIERLRRLPEYDEPVTEEGKLATGLFQMEQAEQTFILCNLPHQFAGGARYARAGESYARWAAATPRNKPKPGTATRQRRSLCSTIQPTRPCSPMGSPPPVSVITPFTGNTAPSTPHRSTSASRWTKTTPNTAEPSTMPTTTYSPEPGRNAKAQGFVKRSALSHVRRRRSVVKVVGTRMMNANGHAQGVLSNLSLPVIEAVADAGA